MGEFEFWGYGVGIGVVCEGAEEADGDVEC